jgi:mono/diheme cytochrome c family protein
MRMRFCLQLVLVISLLTAAQSFAQENGAKEMYGKYCASCHGLQGTGDGPVSRELRVKVPDLTVLKRNNGGTYPLDKVVSAIDGRRAVKAHGTRNMPVWGEVFRQEHEKEKYTELTSLLKAKLIAEYMGTLQK